MPPPSDDFKASPTYVSPNLINMTNMTRHHTQFPLTTGPTKQTSRQSSLAFPKLDSPSPSHDDLIINHPCHAEQPLIKFASQKLPPICHENPLEIGPSILYGGTLCPCFTGKSCICCLNICKELQTKAC